MSKGQKLVKFFAIVLAITLIISIVSFVITLIFSILHITSSIKDTDGIMNNEVVNVYSEDVLDNLEIDVYSAKVYIKEGEKFQVTTDSNYVSTRQSVDTFIIQEEEHFIKDSSSVTIYVPKDFKFKDVEINIGAGEFEVDVLNANKLYFSLGAGTTTIYDMNIEKAIINTGTGELEIKNGVASELDLSTGIGDTYTTLDILKRANLDAGVGNLKLTILDNKEKYLIDVSKGIGNITVDGTYITEDSVIANGDIELTVTGGIGNIDIDFLDLI